MTIVLEVFRNNSWMNFTDNVVKLVHRSSTRSLEKLEFEMVDADVMVGERVRLRRGDIMLFEGVVYDRRVERSSGSAAKRVESTAYSMLILYEKHYVYRSYGVGVSAGNILRDLASLEQDVDVTEVDEGPTLKTVWDIQNASALDVMMKVAKGTNYTLRMKPGRRLFYKPKTSASPSFTVNDSHVVSAEYSEDRWNLRNKVVYVGAGGVVLAEASEPPGDLPMVVHDPFLTDVDEALRRAQTRLEMCREFGRQLRLKMHRAVFDSLGVEAGAVASVNIPSVGLFNTNLFVVETSYSPHETLCEVTLGGKLEYLEDFLSEALQGDTAALFGQSIQLPEYVTTVYSSVNAALKIQAKTRVVRLINKPPIAIDRGAHVVLDENGYATLFAGALSGWFETSCFPVNDLFNRWLRVHIDVDRGGGNVSASLKRVDDSVVANNTGLDYVFPYFPTAVGFATEQNASEWLAIGGSASDSENGVISRWSIKATKTSSTVKLIYPSAMNLGLNPAEFRYLRFYLYSVADDSSFKVRICTSETSYREATINHRGGVWRRYEISIPTMQATGNPSTINWLEFQSTLPVFYIDSDHLLLPALREKLILRFTLTRPSAQTSSPKVKLAKFVWLEG